MVFSVILGKFQIWWLILVECFRFPFFSLLPEILGNFCAIFSTPPLGSARLFTVIIPGDENEKEC